MKPENILLKNGICKIADFGFAKETSGSRVFNHTILGTPLFMAPELLAKKPYTSKSDIWALGCIAYQIFHGDVPFSALTEKELIRKIRS